MMKQLHVLDGHIGWVKNAEPVSDTHVLTAGFDGTVRLWDVTQPNCCPAVRVLLMRVTLPWNRGLL